MKNKKGFTLVELLAVIVILSVILVIAVPKITGVIKDTKVASLRSSAKMIVRSLETDYSTKQTLGTTPSDVTAFASCPASIATFSTSEYTCTYTMTGGVATVKLSGVTGGKFAGCNTTVGVTAAEDGTITCP